MLLSKSSGVLCPYGCTVLEQAATCWPRPCACIKIKRPHCDSPPEVVCVANTNRHVMGSEAYAYLRVLSTDRVQGIEHRYAARECPDNEHACHGRSQYMDLYHDSMLIIHMCTEGMQGSSAPCVQVSSKQTHMLKCKHMPATVQRKGQTTSAKWAYTPMALIQDAHDKEYVLHVMNAVKQSMGRRCTLHTLCCRFGP